jgi:hypothetical protein
MPVWRAISLVEDDRGRYDLMRATLPKMTRATDRHRTAGGRQEHPSIASLWKPGEGNRSAPQLLTPPVLQRRRGCSGSRADVNFADSGVFIRSDGHARPSLRDFACTQRRRPVLDAAGRDTIPSRPLAPARRSGYAATADVHRHACASGDEVQALKAGIMRS